MADTTTLINKTGNTILVYPHTVTPGQETAADVIAVIPANELFGMSYVPTNDNWTTINVIAAELEDGTLANDPVLEDRVWNRKYGWMYNQGTGTPSAYENGYGSTQTVHLSDTNVDVTGQVFEVRRKTPMLLIDHMAQWGYVGPSGYVKQGDAVMVINGKSDDALEGYLRIKACRINGVWYSKGDDTRQAAVDTGITTGANFIQSANIFALNW